LYHNTAAIAAFAALVFLGSAGAADAESARIDIKVDIRIAPDRSITETWHQETTPLAESAVRGAAESKWIVSGNETFEVIEAFTRKADGRVVPADPGDFVTQDGVVGAAMSFADVKLHQIPFRDLSVGDTTVLTVRSTEKEHYIPGQYSHPMVLAPSTAKRTFDVTLRAPAALEIRHDEQQLAYEEVKAGDETVRHWSGTAEPTTTEEKDVADLAFALPGLRYSTFPSFEAIATSYYESAKPKLAVTPEIERLAQEITAGKQDPRAQAEAIFEWVSRNIRYVAVFFGNGRYVPNDTHTILSRRFGDCKDYAALLAALLAAKGIESEQVLIGAGADYRLPKTPMLQAFNHVIVYVPAFDRYLDPTVAFSSFDHPPSRDLDKPVVRVSDRGARLARAPRFGIEDNVVTLDSRVTMTRQGPQRGETTIEARGEFADVLRAFVAEAEAKGKDLELANLARLRGFLGTFALDAPPWTERREPFRVTAKWEAQQAFDPVPAGWRVPPAFSPMVPHPNLFFGGLEPHQRVYPAVCRAGRIVHTLDVALPEGIVPGPLPAAIEQHAPQFSFQERWWVESNHLRVRTEISSSVTGMVCAQDQINAVRTAYGTIEQRTNPVLTFASRPINSPAQAQGPAARQPNPDASVVEPSQPAPSPPGELRVGTSNYNPNLNPNCRSGGDQLKCLQGVSGLRSSTGQLPPSGTVHTIPITPNKVNPTASNEPKQSGGTPSNPVQTFELTRAVPIDHKIEIDFIYALNPDCSLIGLPTARVIGQPSNGNVAVENGTGFANFPPENQRYECNKRKSDGVSIVYVPHPGFTGADSITLDIIFPRGLEMKRHYLIEVK
jgi:transglutaminase-like putative cysteine protease